MMNSEIGVEGGSGIAIFGDGLNLTVPEQPQTWPCFKQGDGT